MDSKEDILTALDEFNRKTTDKVPPLLERYLHRIAATGETLFAWPKLEQLFVRKLDLAMKEFFEKVPTDGLPTCPNVENVSFEDMRQRLLKTVGEFTGAPFTIQRLCELITNPQKHYKRTDKFMRGIEKNLLVVSTVDPYGNKIVRETSKTMVNGLDANGYENDKLSPDTPERHFCPPPAPTSSPNTNGNHGDGAPMSSWFPGTSSDTVCPWGGNGGHLVAPVLTSPAGDASSPAVTTTSTPVSSTSSTTDTPTTTQVGKEAELTVKEATPGAELGLKEAGQGGELAESSSSSSSSSSSDSSSGSSPSSQSITPPLGEGEPPLGEVDKDSADSNESIDTSDSSSSEGSNHDPEAEQQPQADTSQAKSESPAPTPPVTKSSTPQPTDCKEQAVDTQRESTKRTIEQHHTETQNKRPRIDGTEATSSDDVAAPSNSVAAPTEDVPTPTDEVTQPSSEVTSPTDEAATPTDKEALPNDEVATSDAVESSVGDEEESTPVAAEVQESRDSQDSMGFDTPVPSDADIDSTEASKPEPSSETPTEEPTPTASSNTESSDKVDVTTTENHEEAATSSVDESDATPAEEKTEVSSTEGSDVNSHTDTVQTDSDVTSQTADETPQSCLPQTEAMDLN